MSYLLIRVHSYQCDQKGCKKEEEHAEPDKRRADKIMRRNGWYVTPREVFCPDHRHDN